MSEHPHTTGGNNVFSSPTQPEERTDEMQALIAKLRMNAKRYHDYCVRDVLIEAADALAALGATSPARSSVSQKPEGNDEA